MGLHVKLDDTLPHLPPQQQQLGSDQIKELESIISPLMFSEGPNGEGDVRPPLWDDVALLPEQAQQQVLGVPGPVVDPGALEPDRLITLLISFVAGPGPACRERDTSTSASDAPAVVPLLWTLFKLQRLLSETMRPTTCREEAVCLFRT
ncbi:hypothetical protein EYF80_004448 [Liparis tanakae]|uniref:Uncharacterized protein n=1 Tax=Liparis tanakae TaxID=230148 RepID=A0A4Z2J5G8_9TELE|nr:hypothetical protein EYF80_004448 [Liparis tanakae]